MVEPSSVVTRRASNWNFCVEVRRMIRDESAIKAENPYGSEEKMKSRAKEGYFVRDPERDLVYCPERDLADCLDGSGSGFRIYQISQDRPYI